MSNVKSVGIILKALIKNKLRFGRDASTGKKSLTVISMSVLYALILGFAIIITVAVGGTFAAAGFANVYYFVLLLTGALFVLVFGIINLVSTLYLSRDTDFYSALPVNPTAVFAAKMLFVYLLEAVIAVGIILPAAIVYGILIKAWAWYYVITLFTVMIVPALPLVAASILAVPVMFIAGKLKNRSMVALVFYIVLFVAFFAVYMYFIYSMNNITDIDITEEQLASIVEAMTVAGYILYPFTALSNSALGMPAYGLDAGAATAVNLVIFLVISVALICVVLLLGKLMYSQSAKANNQTDNSRSKRSEYKTSGRLKALVKREINLALRATQTAFQCFSVFIIPIVFTVLFCLMGNRVFNMPDDIGIETDPNNSFFIVCGMLATILPSVGNAAITSFSREGGALAALKAMPLDGKDIVRAKTLTWIVPAVVSVVVSAVIANAFYFQPLRFVLSIVAFAALAAAYTMFCVLWDLRSPKLKWTNQIEAVKGNMHATICMILSMLIGAAVLIASIVMFYLDTNAVIYNAVIWAIVLCEAVVLFIIDANMYKSANANYNKIEI